MGDRGGCDHAVGQRSRRGHVAGTMAVTQEPMHGEDGLFPLPLCVGLQFPPCGEV